MLLEGQLDLERERERRLQEERDEAVASAGKAMNEVEALKSENRALKTEVANLKRQLQAASKIQHQPSVKERIKEQVNVERKKDLAHRTHIQAENKNPTDRSFIQVCQCQRAPNSRPMRSRSYERRLNRFARLLKKVLQRRHRNRNQKTCRSSRWRKRRKTPTEMFRYILCILF